jgi:hypothetical protein
VNNIEQRANNDQNNHGYDKSLNHARWYGSGKLREGIVGKHYFEIPQVAILDRPSLKKFQSQFNPKIFIHR